MIRGHSLRHWGIHILPMEPCTRRSFQNSIECCLIRIIVIMDIQYKMNFFISIIFLSLSNWNAQAISTHSQLTTSHCNRWNACALCADALVAIWLRLSEVVNGNVVPIICCAYYETRCKSTEKIVSNQRKLRFFSLVNKKSYGTKTRVG